MEKAVLRFRGSYVPVNGPIDETLKRGFQFISCSRALILAFKSDPNGHGVFDQAR